MWYESFLEPALHVCSWKVVTRNGRILCDEDGGRNPFVTGVALDGCGLTGTIPEDFVHGVSSNYFTTMQLAGNRLQGTLPSSR